MSEELVKATYKVIGDFIHGFFKEHRNLSNFGDGKVEYEGLVYPSREAAYQAAKSLDPEVRKQFLEYTPAKAKEKGREVQLREDWEEIKDEVMYQVVKNCVDNNDDIRQLLLSTGDKYLEETNWWGDKYWGVYHGVGRNMLGHILMAIRDKFKGSVTI